jgi:hypothetical protein
MFLFVCMWPNISKKNYICLNNKKKTNIMAWFSIFKNLKKLFPLIFLYIFLDLITSLLNPWELGIHFKKLFFFLLIYEIMNLYVRFILNIK